MREFDKYLYNIFEENGARHNSMTTLCYAFFKYEKNWKLVEKKKCTVLKCTQMRARVEKGPSWDGTSLGERGEKAVTKELQKIHDMNTYEPMDASKLSYQ